MSSAGVSDRKSWLRAVLVVFVAAWLRLAHLQTIPFGWHPDEATKALLARDVLAGKYFPAFFSAFTGREALYVYLEALFFAAMGESIFAARLLSAFSGILTVALTYTACRRLFNRRVAIFAAIFLATSLWHLIASRNGYRAVIQPLVQLPVLILLFQGWRSKGRASLAAFGLAGVWLGLTQYTYTAARFFPLFIVLLVLAAAILKPRRVWSTRYGLLLAAGASLLVVTPLALHFIQNPIDFYGRASQISVFSAEWAGGDPWARLWQSVKESARMFTVWGDINFRFNIAGQPVFGMLDGFLFYGGLVVCLWRIGRTRPEGRLPYVALILWLLVMLLPMTLSAESLPYFQRAIGALPAVTIFPALALDLLFGFAHARKLFRPRTARVAGALLTLALFAWLGARVAVDYFDRWHGAQRNDDDRRVAMVYVADYLKQHGAPQSLYLSTQYIQHPTLALLAPQYYDKVRWFDATQSLPLPPGDSEATYLLLRENAPQRQLLEAAPDLQHVDTGYDRFQRPVFDVYQWRNGEWPVAGETETAYWSWAVSFGQESADERHAIPLPANFGDVLSLAGYTRRPQAAGPGETLALILFWELQKRPQRHYTFFAHLLDENGQVVAGYDANSYPSPFWPQEGGELLLSYFPLPLSATLAPGVYQLEIGVYHQPSGERLPILEDGVVVADRLLLEPLVIGNEE